MTISRRQLFIAVGIITAALTFWLWPEARWNYRNFPPPATGPWVAFGDSLTEGYGAGAGGDYPSQLSKLLGVPIQNFGVSGETSAAGLRRIAEVEELAPSVVLLCFGGNDVLQGLPRDRMIANVGAMIDRLHARGSFVVLIGIRGASVIGDANAKAFKELAIEKEVFHIPNMLDGILTQPQFMSDYVHPNDAGYAQIAARIAEEMRPLMPKLAAAKRGG